MWFKKKKSIEEVIDTINHKDIFKRILMLCFGCFLSSIAFNVFFLPESIVYGGVSGLSIIFKRLFNITPTIFIYTTYVVILVIGYMCLGKEKTIKSLVGSIIFPFMVFLTTNFKSYMSFDVNNTLLAVIFGAVLSGIGSGIIFKSGFDTGGTDIIKQILNKYFKLGITKAMFIVDGIIVLAAGFFLTDRNIFAWEKVMYAIIVLYILSIVIDKIVLGISSSKCFYIVTTNETSVKNFIMNYLNHGVTVLDGRGGFTGDHRKVIMCIIPTREYFTVKEGIHNIDPNAFFLVTDAYEVYGGE